MTTPERQDPEASPTAVPSSEPPSPAAAEPAAVVSAAVEPAAAEPAAVELAAVAPAAAEPAAVAPAAPEPAAAETTMPPLVADAEPSPEREAGAESSAGSPRVPSRRRPRPFATLVASLRSLPPAVIIVLLVAGPATLTSVVLVLLSMRGMEGEAPAPAAAASTTTTDVADAGADAADDADADAGEADAGPPGDAPFRVRSLERDPSLLVTEVALGKRPFVTAMAQAGVSTADTHRLIAAFRPLRSLDRCGAKDTLTVVRERRGGRLFAFELASSPFDIWQARRVEDTRFEATKLALRVERRPVAVAFSVDGELRASLVKAGLDEDMLAMLDDALHGHVELASVRPGSRLRLLASEDRVEGLFRRYAELEAVEYLPADPKGTPLRVYHFGGPVPEHSAGKPRPGGFYDARGRQPFSGGYRSPVPLARISSRFNPRRVHPVLHVVMPHMGVDFAAPPGTPVYSTAPGVVRTVGDGGPCGNMVQVLHPSGLVSAYCHLSRFAGGLRSGLHVEGRQLLGYVGQTGRATGPHLHFAIKRGEGFLDPLSLRLDGFRVVPAQDREAFDAKRAELDARLDGVSLPPPPPGSVPADAGAPESAEDEINDEAP